MAIHFATLLLEDSINQILTVCVSFPSSGAQHSAHVLVKWVGLAMGYKRFWQSRTSFGVPKVIPWTTFYTGPDFL